MADDETKRREIVRLADGRKFVLEDGLITASSDASGKDVKGAKGKTIGEVLGYE
ncbi:MAG: hypothetical protein P1U69_03190 [Parvibaculaceae bacterium]|nr:hypothetical protein [Parvibaculaceae bacterium]